MSDVDEEFRRRQDRLWSWALHEDILFVYRSNVFAVAEAMLIAAFVAVAQGTVPKPLLMWTMVAAGELFTLVWLYAAFVQYYFTVKPIHDELKDALTDWFRIEVPRHRWPGPSAVMGGLFPAMLTVIWILLGIFA